MNFIRRHALAIACIVGPIVFGLFSVHALIGYVMTRDQISKLEPELTFRGQAPAAQQESATPTRDGSAPATRATRGPEASGRDPGGGQSDRPPPKANPNPQLEAISQHFAGRINFAVASAFLCLMSAFAFAFGAVVLWRHGGWILLVCAVVGFGAVSVWAAYDIAGRELGRAFVVDKILTRADGYALLMPLSVGAKVTHLIGLNTFGALFAVGMILGALYCASMREHVPTLAQLKSRLLVIRFCLLFASAILVVAVVANKALLDWPLSILADGDRKALEPAAEALSRQWGATATMALLAAFIPAVTAWYLDRETFRGNQLAAPAGPAAGGKDGSEKPERAAELEIAPLPALTAIVTVLAPMLAPPIVELMKVAAGFARAGGSP
jgi:hypothetical protein